mgnify:CR=1 FL=1
MSRAARLAASADADDREGELEPGHAVEEPARGRVIFSVGAPGLARDVFLPVQADGRELVEFYAGERAALAAARAAVPLARLALRVAQAR